MADSINGWKPPIFYDVSTDTKRIATQEDIDNMQRALATLGGFYRRVKEQLENVQRHLKASGPSDI